MNNAMNYTLGIDIGSTTVKIAILNEAHHILFPIIKDILPTFRRPCLSC